ncbi:MAG: Glycine-tRNA ligase [Parcubacteria group bacterium GW2011_GWA1_47_11]|uniref:Glycine--tRNA ligase n=1 Tax=Candidatus Colwellbacteria bacterium GWA2_46_10 TaxID=1797684 RepID=A0A1G1YX75_9BACT|nr:MAG: Glycine-tRNA ligase [Parcubacteria group bacterium GW2011_GWA2_46_10]KKU55809.1 MAG: Glycine-tRNA ligase [Parcubacteria group bacterium GW2011_GWA1_47_11]OGY56904.1 MAG: glycine--tRNA ligase [Candidatus Colwellbacteria bacterium GWA2_46_10]
MAKEKDPNLMEKVINLSRNRGFIFPGSEIYGGLANSYDLGPLGTELKRNIKDLWWKTFVQKRSDVVGINAGVIMSTLVWQASGHLENFNDLLVECKKCHMRFRADELGKDSCSQCGGNDFTKPTQFNAMFKTNLGPVESKENAVYLRPETAQAMFVDFPEVVRSARMKLPFGIAQVGKAFRNEITPGNFIFRLREFEQMEIEYFIEPPKTKKDWEKYFDLWLKEIRKWIKLVGIDASRVKEVDIPKDERAHYSERTVDIEFEYPFGQKELYGLAYRTDYDLKAHQKHSGKNLAYKDVKSGKEVIPHVIEPSFGVERTMLAVLLSAYSEEKAKSAKGEEEVRVVMKLPKAIAPYKVAVLPLSDKPALTKIASKIRGDLQERFVTDYDVTQSIGKRYRRQDEIGTPYCVTVDFDSVEDNKVTVRDRDTMKQERIAIAKLGEYLEDKLNA